MKLRNKKTGEIALELDFDSKTGMFIVVRDGAIVPHIFYDNLGELARDWEDYEESKKYWFIRDGGNLDNQPDKGSDYTQRQKELGNYFSTKEEAERAVEKLKAWKRLREKGFRFVGCNHECKRRTEE